MTRNATLFREVGASLWGAHWHLPLADALEVSDRTVRRWARGDFQVPEGVWSDLAAICTERGLSLTKLAERLKTSH